MIKNLYNIEKSLNSYHKNLLFIIYLSIVFTLNYLLLSNEDYLKGLLEKTSSSVENREMIEMTERGMNAFIQNPVLILFLSLNQVWRNTYSMGLLIIMCWLVISFYTSQWISILKMYYLIISALVILILGLILNFVLLHLTYSPVSLLEFGVLLDYFSLHPLIKKLSKGYELFTVLFFLVLSKIISFQYNEKFIAIFFLVNLSWLIIIIVSYFLEFSVALSL